MFWRKPSNDRDWRDDVEVLPTAEVSGESVTIHNVRDFKYRSAEDYDINYYDRTYDLNKLRDVYVGVVYFSKNPYIVHILLKFVFDNDELIFSSEVRKQQNQRFIAWRTMLNDYELAYLFGSTSDMIELREKHRIGEKVHFFKLNLDHRQAAQLLKDICLRTNELLEKPEFFNLFTNSCGINTIRHINKVAPRRLSPLYPFFVTATLSKWTDQKIIKTNL